MGGMNTEKEPVRCINQQKADIRFQDGGLPYVLGAKNYQVLRANRRETGSVVAWTYNHAPMLAYWENRFWIEYLSGVTGEHIPPSRTLLTDSPDGRNWSEPREIFPPLTVEASCYHGPLAEKITQAYISCIMHQRMGFFVSQENKLLALGFYGISPVPEIAPNNGYGIGRTVREIYRDGSFSPVYFLRRNICGGFTGAENLFPDFSESPDEGFQKACRELLADKIIRQQWWEEERLDQEFFGISGGKAISCYSLCDGTVMGVCKNSMVTQTNDGGEHWTPFVKCPSLETSTGKVWGQRTSDGRYVLAYNPTTDSAHRWPLALVTGEDGRTYDCLSSLTPEISPCRYAGILKNLGAQYVRGIWETYPQPVDGGLWLTYSMNKEDIWAAQVPVPIKNVWTGPVDEILNEETIKWWNLNSLKWAPVTLFRSLVTGESCLRIVDTDPCDRPRALRIFEKAEKVRLTASVMVQEAPQTEGMVVELQDESGRVPVRLHFRGDGYLYVRSGGRESQAALYKMGRWLELEIMADCLKNSFTVCLRQGGVDYQKEYSFSQSVYGLERVLFTTKTVLPWNTLEDSGRDGSLGDLPGSEERCAAVACQIGRLKVSASSEPSL